MCRLGDVSLIWKFSGDILNEDPLRGAKIFNDWFLVHDDAAKTVNHIRAVCDYLHNFPASLGNFLEFLVSHLKLENSEFAHTQLALHYIDQIGKTSQIQRSTVNSLRCLLRTSSCLDLNKLKEALKEHKQLPHEQAIVYGRLGDHTTANEIFINELQDFDAAEEYCACVDSVDAWNSLLAVCVSQTKHLMLGKVIDLLKRRPHQFGVNFTLKHLPDETRIDAVAPYITFAVRETQHENRIKQVRFQLKPKKLEQPVLVIK